MPLYSRFRRFDLLLSVFFFKACRETSVSRSLKAGSGWGERHGLLWFSVFGYIGLLVLFELRPSVFW